MCWDKLDFWPQTADDGLTESRRVRSRAGVKCWEEEKYEAENVMHGPLSLATATSNNLTQHYIIVADLGTFLTKEAKTRPIGLIDAIRLVSYPKVLEW